MRWTILRYMRISIKISGTSRVERDDAFRERNPVTAVEAEQSSSFEQAILDLIGNLGKPVVAAVNGFALGGSASMPAN